MAVAALVMRRRRRRRPSSPSPATGSTLVTLPSAAWVA
jgi:hypothetical protein